LAIATSKAFLGQRISRKAKQTTDSAQAQAAVRATSAGKLYP